jgi:TetR/AcrR family transcriptional regulator, transcriptional repressor for nem operon
MSGIIQGGRTMRYDSGHKEATREKILAEAARRFREEGIDAVGVANLMGGLGLTQGGFYNHFDSKDALAREAVTQALGATREQMEHDGSLVTLVERYLSTAHRDHPGNGCATAALSQEIARASDTVREGFTDELGKILAAIRGALPSAMPTRQKKATAMQFFSLLVGSMSLARAVNAPALSDDILAAGRKAALAMLQNPA